NRSLDQKTTAKPQQQPQPPSRASLLSSCAPTNPRTENEADDEVNASTVRSDGFNIYAAGFGCDSRAPCWTAARLLSDSASPGTILYTGLFDAIGGGPDCARAVAAMSADYAAVAHLHTPSRQRRHSCSFARQGVSPSMSIWRNRTLSDSQASWEEALRDDNAQHQQLATHLGGAGLLADRLPADLLDCHSDAIDRLLSDRIPVSTVEDRLGWALHRLDADLCGLTLPSPSDPC
uniref:Aldo_ket_red domain-containing protein n=1 Tax=Macrostomum lignano TaxID=282301 RepID=A0A1I8HXB6_9PLAT